MQITLDLPDDIARQLTTTHPDLSRTALEGLALEGIRSGDLTTAEVRRLMGFTSHLQVDAFLKAHGLPLQLTADDAIRDAEVSREFRAQWSS